MKRSHLFTGSQGFHPQTGRWDTECVYVTTTAALVPGTTGCAQPAHPLLPQARGGPGGGPGARRSAPKSLPPGSGSSPGQFTCLLYTRGARGSERVVLQQESSHAGKWGEELARRLEGGGGGGEGGGEAAEADAGEECGRQGVTRCPFGKQLGII